MALGLRKPYIGYRRMSQRFGMVGLGIEPEGWLDREGGRPWRASYTARPGWTHHDDLHFGTDWSMPTGTPVVAMERGRVVDVGRTAGRGRYVTVKILGTMTRYRLQHLSDVLVDDGQLVDRGQKLGLSGNSGASTGPHLHVEIWRGVGSAGPRYDPQRLMVGGDHAAVDWIVPVEER